MNLPQYRVQTQFLIIVIDLLMLSYALRIVKFKKTRLDQYSYLKPQQLGVVFAPSNKGWTHRQIQLNSSALAAGLKQYKFIKGDSFLVKLPHKNMEQSFLTRIALANLQGKVTYSKAKNQQQLQKQLKQTQARAFIFDSYDKIDNTTIIDLLYRMIPQIAFSPHNQQIFPQNFNFLRFLIQTDNYKYSGTYQFENFMNFRSQNNYDMFFVCQETPLQIPSVRTLQSLQEETPRPILITNPCDQLAFRAGVLNCLVNGRLLVCIDPKKAKIASQRFNHKVDFICTEPMTDLHSESRVFVPFGSKLYLNHPQRHELIL